MASFWLSVDGSGVVDRSSCVAELVINGLILVVCGWLWSS